MSVGSVYFPLKGLAKLYMRRKVNGVPTGSLVAIYAAQTFDVSVEQDLVEVPGNDIVCYEFANFKKFSIPIDHGAIRMDQLDLFLGGTYTETEDQAEFVERVNYNPTPCELWVQTDVASGDDNKARYYEHYPDAKCLTFQNPRSTGEAVTFSSEFSGYADANGVKRRLVRDLTGVGIPNQLSGDTTPPTVTGSTPAHNATVTIAPAQVLVTVSKALNPVSATRVELVDVATGMPVAGQAAVYEEAPGPVHRVKITLEAPLADGDYWAIVPRTVRDENGNYIASQQVIKFTVDVP